MGPLIRLLQNHIFRTTVARVLLALTSLDLTCCVFAEKCGLVLRFGTSLIATFISRYMTLLWTGLFDGHAGVRAAQFCEKHLHRAIAKKFPRGSAVNRSGSQSFDKEIKKCLQEAFLATDKEFLALAAKQQPVWRDGTTAIAVLLVDDTLYVSNIGDCKAVLCRSDAAKSGGVAAKRLSRDHSPTMYEERMRIQKAGGFIADGRVQGIMEVSRSIGDGRFKSLGVTANPDVIKCKLQMDDKFLLLACDGVWKVFGVDEAIVFVAGALKEAQKQDFKDTHAQAQSVANQLVNESVHRGTTDNVSVILVMIGDNSGPEP
eukprot:m.519837 g.519837  ORF g.519837 m.519837 type:complete len:317 (+) comp21949_c0_seq8:397-1347(+)